LKQIFYCRNSFISGQRKFQGIGIMYIQAQ
jgi:hypothetical protein